MSMASPREAGSALIPAIHLGPLWLYGWSLAAMKTFD